MNTEPVLRKISVLVGLGLLIVSIMWSQDGFNFDLAGASQYGQIATIIGWFLALSVTVIQFVFSTSYKDLNASLKFFGILAYVYSIYTNYWGILHFQGWVDGEPAFNGGAAILAFVMDGVPEPLIAWGLYESLKGDFIGNLLRVLGSAPQSPHPQRQNPPQSPPQYPTPSGNREERHNMLRQAMGENSRQMDIPPFLQQNGGKKNGNVRR